MKALLGTLFRYTLNPSCITREQRATALVSWLGDTFEATVRVCRVNVLAD